jgi:uncharacterized coiled-coil protein SlyX|nr:MAG TPA: shock protein B [Caudoviricetes sp.]
MSMETLLAILTAVFGTGWGIQFFYYRYERRKRKAEVENIELDLDAKHDELQDRQLEKAYKQITELQNIVDSEREKWVELARKLSDLKTELLNEQEARRMAEYDKCTVQSCLNRQPPRK